MNQKIENLIKHKKEQINVSEKQIRDNHLISLGFIDEEKTTRVYLNDSLDATGYDTEKQMYYKGVVVALEVTDEEYAKICEYSPPKATISMESEKSKTRSEITLDIIATIVLVCGIISTVIVFGHNGYFSFTGVFIALGVLLSSLTTWAVLKLFCEIAANIREIKNKTK